MTDSNVPYHQQPATAVRTAQYLTAIEAEWIGMGGEERDNWGPPGALFVAALAFSVAHPELARWWADHQDRVMRSLRPDLVDAGTYDQKHRMAMDAIAHALHVEGVEL